MFNVLADPLLKQVCRYLASDQSQVRPDDLQHLYDQTDVIMQQSMVDSHRVFLWWRSISPTKYADLNICKKQNLSASIHAWRNSFNLYPDLYPAVNESSKLQYPVSNVSLMLPCLVFYNDRIKCLAEGISEVIVFTNHSKSWKGLIALKLLLLSLNDYTTCETLGWIRLAEKLTNLTQRMKNYFIKAFALAVDSMRKSYYYNEYIEQNLQDNFQKQISLWNTYNETPASVSLKSAVEGYSWMVILFLFVCRFIYLYLISHYFDFLKFYFQITVQ